MPDRAILTEPLRRFGYDAEDDGKGTVYVRHCCFGCRTKFFGPDNRAGHFVRPVDGKSPMNGMEILGAISAAGLLIYLTVALVKPEWFS